MSHLILYSRDGCHLCEQAEEVLRTANLPFERCEVSAEAELERRYGWDVPVLVAGGEVLAKGVISRARLVGLGLVQ